MMTSVGSASTAILRLCHQAAGPSTPMKAPSIVKVKTPMKKVPPVVKVKTSMKKVSSVVLDFLLKIWAGQEPPLVGPHPQYGWDFRGRNSGKIPEFLPERPRKRSESVSWNFPREYGWDAPNPTIQGI